MLGAVRGRRLSPMELQPPEQAAGPAAATRPRRPADPVLHRAEVRTAPTGCSATHPRICASRLATTPSCTPHEGLRHSPIKAVVADQRPTSTTSLACSTCANRSRYGSTRPSGVLSVLEANPVFNVLNPAFVSREPMRLDEPLPILCPDGSPARRGGDPLRGARQGRAVARRRKQGVRTSAPWRKTPSPWR